MAGGFSRIALGAAMLVASAILPARAETTLRAAMFAGVSGIDPIWTTATITAYHGAMVYDTLFGVDAKDKPQPQMVDRWTVSPDQLTWEFHLRPGLTWSDWAPVSARDCVASLKRWAARDSAGQMLMDRLLAFTVVDADTFRIQLKEPFGLLLESLAKTGTPLAFMMREQEAMVDPQAQIKVAIGSGPFVFRAEDWNPGNRAVYVKNPRYVPRAEPPSGMAGGKVVKVDRVELLSLPDAQTAHAALIKGEIDFLEAVSLDLLQTLKVPGVTVDVFSPAGYRGVLRMNHLQPPFDNPKARQAMMWLVDQEAYMSAVIGDPAFWSTCGAIFACGSSMESKVGVEWVAGHSVEKARALFKEAGYDGRPVVVLDPTDTAWFHAMAQVTAGLLKSAGVNVQIVAMDWATMMQRRANKAAPEQGGWNIFHTGYNGSNIMGPAGFSHMPANCEKAWFGWPCDAKLESLRAAWAAASPAQRPAIMDQVQARNFEVGVVLPVGQWTPPVAYRSNLSGWVKMPDIIPFWGVEKK